MAEIYDRDTGELIPEDQLSEAVTSGRAEIRNPGPISLVSADGSRIEIPAEQVGSRLGAAIRQGYRIEGSEERAQADAQLDAQGNPILGVAEGLASGATLGLSDVAARQLAPEYADRAAARRQALGGIGTAAEVAGSVIPGLFTGGGAMAYTPAGALARAAASAGRAVETGLAARGVGAATAKVAGLAADGALDGLVSGIGQAASEDSLGDVDLTAERLVAGGAMGGLLGFGTGGAIGLAAGGARKGARAIADRMSAARGAPLDEAAGAADAGWFRHLSPEKRDQLAKSAATVSGADESVLRGAIDDKSIRTDWLKGDQVRQAEAKNLRQSLQSTLDTDHLMKDIGAGEAKIETITRDVKPGRIYAEQAGQEARPILQDYRAVIDETRSYMPKSKWKALDRELGEVSARVERATGKGDSAGAFLALERYKRVLDRRVKLTKLGKGDFLEGEVANSMHAASRDAGDRIRNLLESEEIFGEAGRKQAERNAAWHETLQTGKEFNQNLTAKTGESIDEDNWWIERREIDGDKSVKFVDDLTSDQREANVARVMKHVDSKIKLYETVVRNGEVPADMLPAFEKAITDMRASQQTFSRAQDRLTKIGALDLVAKADREAGQLVNPTMAAAGGFAVGGGVGAAVAGAGASAINALAQPGQMMLKLTRLEALSQRVLGVSDQMRAKTVSAVQELGKPRDTARKIARAGTRSATQLFGSDRKERLQRAKKIETRISEYRADPMRLINATGYQVATMQDVAPRAAFAAIQQTAKAMQFLASKLPPAAPMNALTPNAPPLATWTDASIDQFAKYVAAVDDPRSVIDDLKAGALTPEGVEVLKKLYPKLYEEVRITAVETLANRKTELPYAATVQLSLLLDIPGHPTLNPQFMYGIQEMWKAKTEKDKAKAPSPSNTKPVPIRDLNHTDRLMTGLST